MTFISPRSILFVPASRPDLFRKAAGGAADALCFDLEDGVGLSAKAEARANLELACAEAVAGGKIAMVRVNGEEERIGGDLAALPLSCRAVLLPKARNVAHINDVAQALQEKAQAGGADAVLIPLIEDAKALLALEREKSAFHERVIALCPGTEDFAHTLGCAPDSALIGSVFQRIAVIAAAASVALIGFPGSIANFKDHEKLRAGASAGRACGATGALCIHPAQIDILNEIFSPMPAALDEARRIVAAFDAAGHDGQGAIALDGGMIDLPVYKRAQALLARADKPHGKPPPPPRPADR